MKLVGKVLRPGALALCFVLSAVGLFGWLEPVAADDSRGVYMEAEGIFQLAKVKMKQKKYSEAEKLLRQLTALNFPKEKKAHPIIAGSHLVLVDSLMRQKKWKPALRDGHTALKLEAFKVPSIYKAEMLKLLGKAFSKTGDDAKAAKYLEDSLNMYKKVRKR